MNWRKLDLGKRIILGGAGVLLLATLFPPWTVTSNLLRGGKQFSQYVRYGFLFDPPLGFQHSGVLGRTTLDVSILLAEWAAIALVTAALYFVLRKRETTFEID